VLRIFITSHDNLHVHKNKKGGCKMTIRKITRFVMVAALLCFVGFSPALADNYPSKPITLIIPDGYTLLFTHNYIDQLQPLLEKLPYDTLKDLKSVCRINYGAASVVVRTEKPWKTLDEMLAYGKQGPGKLVFTTSGNWGATMTPGARVLLKAGVQATYVPYKGGGPAMQALLAGDGDFMMSFPSQAGPLIEAGKIRALASAGDKQVFPNVPTLKSLGYETGTMDRIVMAPKGVPEDRMKILRDAFAKLNSDKTYQRLMARIGENMEYMDGPEYDKIRPMQMDEYRKLVKEISGK
jgi:tripartite-type tricarboxylate transporter receptor subunit TctC